jgi:hypothetical protein
LGQASDQILANNNIGNGPIDLVSCMALRHETRGFYQVGDEIAICALRQEGNWGGGGAERTYFPRFTATNTIFDPDTSRTNPK